MTTFEIYKRGQGKYTRVITFAAGMLVVTAGAAWLSEQLRATGSVYVQYGIPVIFWAAMAVLLFWVVNKPRSADFMIATEGEMKKVSWSSRKEITGSTKVVIFATFALAILLFIVDVVFKAFFQWTGVLQVQR